MNAQRRPAFWRTRLLHGDDRALLPGQDFRFALEDFDFHGFDGETAEVGLERRDSRATDDSLDVLQKRLSAASAGAESIC